MKLMKPELTIFSADNSCFVTGASGFIGKNLVHFLADSGFRVHALVRSRAKAGNSVPSSVSFFQGDLTDRESIDHAMQGCSLVFHLAALAKPFSRTPGDFDRINVEGTRNVLEIALKNQVKKMVFTSTAGVFNPSGRGETTGETDDNRYAYHSDYSRTKAKCEELCREYVKKGVPVVIVNPSRVFGPGELTTGNSFTRIIQLYISGKWHIIPGNGKTIGNYVFIEDVVRGHYLAMKAGIPGEKYILGGENLSFDQVFAAIDKETGDPHFLIKLPLPVLQAIAFALVLLSGLLKKDPPITPSWITHYLEERGLSVRKAEKELDYTVTPFTEAVRKTINWLRQTNTV
jgi:NAD+-dependent farnesol dehydrogenase